MNVHEIIIYTFSGIEVATYPKDKELKMTSAFFSANRLFALSNGYSEVQQINWMQKKCNWLHSRQKDLSFAIITDLDDDIILIRKFVGIVRDRFLDAVKNDPNFPDATGSAPGEMLPDIMTDAVENNDKNCKVFKDKEYDFELKKIVDEIIDDWNSSDVGTGYPIQIINNTAATA